MHNFKQLHVWQVARTFVQEIYLQTNQFPELERFGITSQLRRASVSISSNIAESSGRKEKQFEHFLRMAQTFAFEVENLLILSCDLNYLSQEEFLHLESIIIKNQKMLFGPIKRFNQ